MRYTPAIFTLLLTAAGTIGCDNSAGTSPGQAPQAAVLENVAFHEADMIVAGMT